MNPEIKARWVAALRSGEYKQVKKYLRSDKGMCCLGVLCELHANETGNVWLASDFSECSRYIGEYGVLAAPVIAWAGLELPYGADVSIGGRTTHLTNHNDGTNVPARTFAEIADAIESQL